MVVSLQVAPGPYFVSAPIPEPCCYAPTYPMIWSVIVMAPGYAISTATFCTLDTTDTLPDSSSDRPGAQRVAL